MTCGSDNLEAISEGLNRRDWEYLERFDPGEVLSVMTAGYAVLVENLSDEFLTKMEDVADLPCSKFGCQCEKTRGAFVRVVRLLRDDICEQVKTRGLS